MALLKNNILGEIHGKLGYVTFRKFNGKQFISIRPVHYKKSNSSKAVTARSKFSAIVKFAKAINSVTILSAVWKQSSIKGFSPYHKIIKTNLSLISNQYLGKYNLIVPNSFTSPIKNLSLNSNIISITIGKLKKLIGQIDIKEFQLQFIFVLTYPKYKKYDNLKIIDYAHSFSVIDTSKEFTLNISIGENAKKNIDQYKSCYIYSTLIWQNNFNGRINWSSTFFNIG